TDSMVIFEDVKVPWERVFTHNNAALSRNIYFQTPSHAMGNHQSNVRFSEKLKLIVGIARKSAELNNVLQVPAVRDTLGRLAAAEAGLNAMISGQIEDAEEMIPGHLNVNRRHMYGALHWCTQNYATICETVRELMGGGPFQMPADVSVINNPELKEKFETYWSVPGQSAIERMKFLKMGWDLLGSDFAGRHQQYERFYAGPAFINTLYSFIECPWDEMTGTVDRVLAQYDVPAAGEMRRPMAAE
ncbi:MAG: 4-hydroxyphenylacetate 3-hydroxylase C-terminal domain-containing protein, partial [Alphaproteobacteria bacterium]